MTVFGRSGAGRHDAPRIAVVGCGFTGAAAAAALLRRRPGPFNLTLMDGAASRGRGLAYGRARNGELLNVRARDLALLHEDRGDFAHWLRETLLTFGSTRRPPDFGDVFVPRDLFGQYVEDRLETEIEKRTDVSVRYLVGDAMRIRRLESGYQIDLARGRPVMCDGVVLATGYTARPRFGLAPYSSELDKAARAARTIVIAGSGLTAVDILLSLRAAGSEAEIMMVSRRGLTPRPQLKTAPEAWAWEAGLARTASELLANVRRACRDAQSAGQPWQSVIHGLRAHTSDFWRALPNVEQRRLLRHAGAFWAAHRHRLPADIHQRLGLELARRNTSLRAGAILSVAERDRFEISVRWRGKQTVSKVSADLVVDCTGHKPDLSTPLLAGLLHDGHARTDPHGVGLDVDTAGRVANIKGEHARSLFALGPLGAGALLEITAAPDIARQAHAMADAMCEEQPVQHRRLA